MQQDNPHAEYFSENSAPFQKAQEAAIGHNCVLAAHPRRAYTSLSQV